MVFITSELQVMQSFLHVANKEHAANDKVALTLGRQFRTVAFDVEDCVEYVIEFGHKYSKMTGILTYSTFLYLRFGCICNKTSRPP
ncbi:unnamed protein product [Miscanthus lutarioriparius]|uniref:Disease resistance N-terminal domain-containing protein n=1 Tax=Miscanthus lutarioriparius TaxID=422564 RepID=A0A811RBM7_9POAL|nr:unnamed protein product [Miscanthus lutarioriparius]